MDGSRGSSRATIHELARERLGFEQLRPGQEQAVAAAAAGRDVLAVLPTGGGKSAIYELAGMLRGGPTVVVSPLIALQDDQLAHLQAAGCRPPSSTRRSRRERGRRRSSRPAGPDEFVFVSPEQLANAETREALRRARPGCSSSTRRTSSASGARTSGRTTCGSARRPTSSARRVRIALTATAAPPVRREICRRLGLRDPEIVIGDFDRPHIDLAVQHVRSPEDKQRLIAQVAAELDGSGIVYAATHAGAEAARDTLAAAGERVSLYHAGLGAAARRRAMAAFLDGSARIVAATVAFGMGVDKPDVRWVLHADAPVSLDAYYQELGPRRPRRRGAPRPAAVPARGHRRGAASDRARRVRGGGGRGRGAARRGGRRGARLALGDAGAGPAGRRRRGRVGGRRAGALDRGDGPSPARSPRRTRRASASARSSARGWR